MSAHVHAPVTATEIGSRIQALINAARPESLERRTAQQLLDWLKQHFGRRDGTYEESKWKNWMDTIGLHHWVRKQFVDVQQMLQLPEHLTSAEYAAVQTKMASFFLNIREWIIKR
ncbi:hypothetical protein JCM3765_007568 [Sporobolomyces pararoseus]